MNLIHPKKFVFSVKFPSKSSQVDDYLPKFVQKIFREITRIFLADLFIGNFFKKLNN